MPQYPCKPRAPLNRWIVLPLLFFSAMVMAVGCETTPDERDDDAASRTIVADISRDPQAAAQANEQGLAYLDAGQLREAETAFKRAIKADKLFGPAYNHLGKVYYLRRLYYQAAHQFDKASQLMPNHAAPQNNLGLTLVVGGKLDEAIEAYRKAIALDGYTVEYQANLSGALIQRGDKTEEVIVLLRSVAEHDKRVKMRQWAKQQLATMGVQ